MGNCATGSGSDWSAFAIDYISFLKLFGLAAVVYFTNLGTGERFNTMLLGVERLGFLQLLVEWIVVLVALSGVLFHPSMIFRTCWGTVIATSTALQWLFYRISGNQMSVFDMLSLKEVKNWKTDTTMIMKRQSAYACWLFGTVIVLFVVPGGGLLTMVAARADTFWLGWLPLFCISFIAVEILQQNGITPSPMPTQFSVWAMLIITATKCLLNPMPKRRGVDWQPQSIGKKQNIILLVDESVRGDYVSFGENNRLTPGLAVLSDRLTSFGLAASGGNCSSYSNVIVRFGAVPDRISDTAKSNPSLFAFARKAGYRTVYIDAQAGYQAKGTGLQNFMTLAERSEVDGFYVLQMGPGKRATDFQLADIVAAELKSGQPVFIYANKNGVHYPYHDRYPKDEDVYEPNPKSSTLDARATMISSYRNGINFTVEKFMLYLFAQADLSNTTMIYTSDHGQRFSPGSYPHGMVRNPDPRTGIVPLWAYSSDRATAAAFAEGAKKCEGKASHFLIAPTLYELMGYSRADISLTYPDSMFTGTTTAPRMSTGDIFGFFGSTALFWEIDLKYDYFEHDAQPQLISDRVSPQPQGSDQVLTLV